VSSVCVCALSVCQFGMKDRLATSFGNKARKILTNHAQQMSIQKFQVCTFFADLVHYSNVHNNALSSVR